MNGKQHRQIAPVFTLSSILLANYLEVLPLENVYITAAIATPLSILFANAPDADLYATYPVKVILGKPGKTYNVRRKTNEGWKVKRYTSPKGPINKAFALFFKLIRVRKHRDWKSHSPLIYGPLGLLLIYLANAIPDQTGIIMGLVLGVVLSFWSHILADMPNKGGLQYLPGTKQIGIKNIVPGFMSNLFKSGGKFMYLLLIAMWVEFILFLVAKDVAIKLNVAAYNIIKNIIVAIWNLIVMLFNLLVSKF